MTWLAVLLLAYATIFTVLYLAVLRDFPLFFLFTYGFITTLLVIMDIYIVIKSSRLALKIGLAAALSYGVGFVVWNIDNYHCDNLR